MILKTFAVYDSKAEAYLQPLFAPTIAVALRMFTSAVNDSNTDFHRYAGDYTLFHLGEFDNETGSFTDLKTPYNLAQAITLIENTIPTPPPVLALAEQE